MAQKYLVYGDEEQAKLDELLKKEDRIQELIDSASRKLLNERIKEAKKKKNIADTAKKQIVVENLRDIDSEDIFLGEEEPPISVATEELPDVEPDITPNVITDEVVPNVSPVEREDVVELPKITEKPAENQLAKVDKDYKKSKEVPTEEDVAKRKKKNKKIAVIILVIILLIVMLFFGWVYREKIVDFFHFNNGGDNPTSQNVDIKKVSTLLYKGGEINNNLYNYYESIKADVAIKKSGSDISAAYTSKIKSERTALQNMRADFEAIKGGKEYYNTLVDRYDNLVKLSEGLTFTASQVDTLNQYIATDQALLSRSRTCLINMLDTNGVSWTEENGEIKWSVEN